MDPNQANPPRRNRQHAPGRRIVPRIIRCFGTCLGALFIVSFVLKMQVREEFNNSQAVERTYGPALESATTERQTLVRDCQDLIRKAYDDAQKQLAAAKGFDDMAGMLQRQIGEDGKRMDKHESKLSAIEDRVDDVYGTSMFIKERLWKVGGIITKLKHKSKKEKLKAIEELERVWAAVGREIKEEEEKKGNAVQEA